LVGKDGTIRGSPGRLGFWLAADVAELLEQRVAQARSGFFRERRRLGITKNLDCVLGGIHDDSAVFTTFEMFLDGGFQRLVQSVFKVVGKLLDDVLAIHEFSLRLKYLFNFWRNFSRARSNRDFTAGIESPSASAVSSVDSSSMSRSWKTIRKGGSSSPITFVNISDSSVWA